jgi:hypothetical protein
MVPTVVETPGESVPAVFERFPDPVAVIVPLPVKVPPWMLSGLLV